MLSGTKGGQVHTLPCLEESGWFFRTVLPCKHPTTLAWEDPALPPLTLAQPRGGEVHLGPSRLTQCREAPTWWDPRDAARFLLVQEAGI